MVTLDLQGIFSHWITDDLIAMARPNTSLINKKNGGLIKEFEKHGIRSVVNLQTPGRVARFSDFLSPILKKFYQIWGQNSLIPDTLTPGEHASCGPKLESSGFTYDPNDFMKNNIFYYNFTWKDYGEVSMANLLDMVKVEWPDLV